MLRKLGQVIALSRLVLASVFLLAIYLDPSQPSAAPSETYVVLALYVVIALALVVTTWRNIGPRSAPGSFGSWTLAPSRAWQTAKPPERASVVIQMSMPNFDTSGVHPPESM